MRLLYCVLRSNTTNSCELQIAQNVFKINKLALQISCQLTFTVGLGLFSLKKNFFNEY